MRGLAGRQVSDVEGRAAKLTLTSPIPVPLLMHSTTNVLISGSAMGEMQFFIKEGDPEGQRFHLCTNSDARWLTRCTRMPSDDSDGQHRIAALIHCCKTTTPKRIRTRVRSAGLPCTCCCVLIDAGRVEGDGGVYVFPQRRRIVVRWCKLHRTGRVQAGLCCPGSRPIWPGRRGNRDACRLRSVLRCHQKSSIACRHAGCPGLAARLGHGRARHC
jgi:hypothetical protein